MIAYSALTSNRYQCKQGRLKRRMENKNPKDFLEVFAESTDVETGLRTQYLSCKKCGYMDFRIHKTSDGGIEFSCSHCAEKGTAIWAIKLVPTINLKVTDFQLEAEVETRK
jgi:ssDNA-binding Zn-finger/Zn-ribbon topoisomerase 1